MLLVLPSGLVIRARVLSTPFELRSGLMGLERMADDRGVLFLHPRSGMYLYWTLYCRFPLDIVWLDENFEVVELCTDVPPCPGPASECPRYGGHFPARCVLETNAGILVPNGVCVGVRLNVL
jgi:uncharacterized membrane protein (UPF0127 family)